MSRGVGWYRDEGEVMEEWREEAGGDKAGRAREEGIRDGSRVSDGDRTRAGDAGYVWESSKTEREREREGGRE